MSAQRSTVKLSDGTEVRIRELNQIDLWDILKVDGHYDRAMRMFELAIEAPEIEFRGLPKDHPGKLHIRDIGGADFDLLQKQVEATAFGGTLKDKFPSPEAPAAGDAGRPG